MSPKPRAFDGRPAQKKRSVRKERALADEIGGRVLLNSGAVRLGKRDSGTTATAGADFQTDSFIFEHKMTIKDSVVLKADWLRQIKATADRTSKHPALVLTFQSAAGDDDWVMVPKHIFKLLTGFSP